MNKASLKIANVPYLMAQWSANNPEDPAKISAGSHNSFIWECKTCGYTWETSAKARYNSGGKCPCHETNKVIVSGINDVFTLMPELKAYYDAEKNDAEGIDASKEGFDSSLAVNWKCPDCSRQWKTTIRARFVKDNGVRKLVHCPHYNTVKRKAEDVPTVAHVPAMMRFWDASKNPDAGTVKSNSPEHAFWRCTECGYEWKTTVITQANGTGKCACCELHIATKAGINDLFTLIPEAKRSYDFDKNEGIDIYSMGVRSKESVWWKCPDCGNSWQAPIASRVEGKKGSYSFRQCQKCYLSGADRITPASSNKKITKYWDFEKNNGRDINLTSLYSQDMVNWKCKDCGHTWSATVKGMNSSDGCPHCNKREFFVNSHPEIMNDLDKIFSLEDNPFVDLRKLRVNSDKEVNFHCRSCDYRWTGNFGNRIRKNDDGTYRILGCPMCDNNRCRDMTYDQQYPELSEMYNERLSQRSLASVTSYESNTLKLFWDCPTCKRSFTSRLQSMIVARSTSTKGCPYCSRTLLAEGESFGDIHPEFLDEYAIENETDPFEVFPSCKEEVLWRCVENPGHTWKATFALRHSGGGNCPVCNRTRLIKGVNTFADVHPEYLDMYSENNERKPDDIFYNSVLWLKWNCRTCHGEYGAYIKDVVSDEESCPYCSNRYVLSGYNDLKTLYPDIADMWSDNNELQANQVFPTSRMWAYWNCPDCGGEYHALMDDVVSGKHTCPYCDNRLILSGFNDFATKHPDLMKEYNDINQIIVDRDCISEKSHVALWWNCLNNSNHVYNMSPSRRLWYRKRHRESCPFCKGLRYKKSHY